MCHYLCVTDAIAADVYETRILCNPHVLGPLSAQNYHLCHASLQGQDGGPKFLLGSLQAAIYRAAVKTQGRIMGLITDRCLISVRKQIFLVCCNCQLPVLIPENFLLVITFFSSFLSVLFYFHFSCPLCFFLFSFSLSSCFGDVIHFQFFP